MKIGYLGWLGHWNFGDDLCYLVFRQHFPEHEWVPWPAEQRSVDFVLAGGGTLLSFRRDHFMGHLARLLVAGGTPFGIWGSGVEPLDRGGIGYVPESYWAPEDVSLLAEVLDRARFVGVRGPLSWQLLQPFKDVQVVGDPGLLVPRLRVKKRGFLLFSCGHAGGFLFGRSEDHVYNAFRAVMQWACNAGHAVVVMPAWVEDTPGCRRLASSVLGDVRFYEPSSVGGGLRMLAAARAIVALKLHVGIGAVAQGTPFVQAAYRTKCYDFARSVGAEDALVSTDEPELAGKLRGKLEACLSTERNWDEARIEELRIAFSTLREHLS